MLALVIAAAVAAGTPADGPTTVSPANVNGKKIANDPNETVCHNEEVTGSRMTKRVCATRGQWEKRAADGQEALRYYQETRADAPAATMSSPAGGH